MITANVVRPLGALVALFLLLAGDLRAQVDTGPANPCSSVLGQDVGCDPYRVPQTTPPDGPQPAPPMATSAGTWDEYDFSKPAQNWQRLNQPGGGRFGQMAPSLGGDVANSTGVTSMTRAQNQAGAGGAGGMSTWLAVLAAFMGVAAIASGS